MAKVYVFNPQAQTGVTVLSIYVNGAPTPYQVRFTSKAIGFIPYSTAGERSTERSGNKWALDNTVLVEGVPPSLHYQVDLPLPVTVDLILYVFYNKMALFGVNGNFLKFYLPKDGEWKAAVPQGHEAKAAEANGKVYVFNLFSEDMRLLSTNSLEAGSIPGWSKGGSEQPPIFTPSVLEVGRVLNRSEAPGHFVNGSNSVFTQWASGPGSFSLTIDGSSFPISEDLLLFILRDRWLLVNRFGVQKSDGPIQPAGFTHATAPRHD